MTPNLTVIIELICLVHLLNIAEPIEYVKKFLLISEETKATKEWHMFVITLFNCYLCLGFWVGLIYWHEVLFSCLFAVACELFCICYRKISNGV